MSPSRSSDRVLYPRVPWAEAFVPAYGQALQFLDGGTGNLLQRGRHLGDRGKSEYCEPKANSCRSMAIADESCCRIRNLVPLLLSLGASL